MYIQQLYTSCLAEAAYYIESNGEAAIIDPLRETQPYIDLANSRNAKIKYVFETHFHADFVSGHIDLAKKTGSTIIYGPEANTDYKVYNAKHGEEFKLGDITFRAIHTPGHTPESTCYLLLDESYQEYCIFTGDTLFVGDVGRPDLLDGKMSKEELAGMMYDSLNTKIKTLPDEVIVYPAHGPGSSCGKSLGKETWSTIGQQKQSNYALQEMSREEFIKQLTSDLAPPPAYFFQDAMINKRGYATIDDVIHKNMRPLSVAQFEQELKNGAMILDTRNGMNFEKGFIAGSIFIGLEGMFAIWVGTLIDIHRPLILVCDDGREEESVLRLARVGYENVTGYLKGGIQSWIDAGKPIEKLPHIDPVNFAKKVREDVSVLDVRKLSEVEDGHIPGAMVIPMQELQSHYESVGKDEPVYIHCAGGYRSVIASSFLMSKGYTNVINVHGGWRQIKNTDVPVETGTPSNFVA